MIVGARTGPSVAVRPLISQVDLRTGRSGLRFGSRDGSNVCIPEAAIVGRVGGGAFS
jgi:hypothetical protein